jgi:hypothetical protein
MSLLTAAHARKSEEAGAAEPIGRPIEVAAPPAPGAVVEHDAESSSTVAGSPHRADRSVRPAPVGASGISPMPGTSPLGLHAPQGDPQHLGFLESARMDREMARELHASSQPRGQKSATSILGALLNMSTQRFRILGAGVLLLMLGLLALRFPVFLSAFDQWGFQINCGTGLQSNFTQVAIADPTGSQFVDQCHTAIVMRRAWAVPLAAAGAMLLGGLLVIPPRQHPANLGMTGQAPKL